MNIFSIYICYTCPLNIHCHFNCTDSCLVLRSRTFSLKINKLPTFLKSLKRGNVQRLSLYGQMSSHTEFQLPITF